MSVCISHCEGKKMSLVFHMGRENKCLYCISHGKGTQISVHVFTWGGKTNVCTWFMLIIRW